MLSRISPSYSCELGIESQAFQLFADLIQIDWVHGNHHVRTVVSQEIGCDDELAASRQVFALSVGVDVHDKLDLVGDANGVETPRTSNSNPRSRLVDLARGYFEL